MRTGQNKWNELEGWKPQGREAKQNGKRDFETQRRNDTREMSWAEKKVDCLRRAGRQVGEVMVKAWRGQGYLEMEAVQISIDTITQVIGLIPIFVR